MLDQDADVYITILCSDTGVWMRFIEFNQLLIETKRLHAFYERNPKMKWAPEIPQILFIPKQKQKKYGTYLSQLTIYTLP